MKFFVLIFIVFMVVMLTISAAMNPEKQKSNKQCKTVALEAGYYETVGEEKRDTSNEESPCQGNKSQCPVQTEGRVAPQQPELEIRENISVAPNYFYGLRPVQRTFDWNGQWQRIVNVPELTGASYNGIQYYGQPPLFPAYGNSQTYLPPAVPTYARRSIPELHNQIYRKPNRVIRSREQDDLMAELQHMAMMNNILPTMPIPFLRSSSYVPYEASSLGGATALYPASVSNCALPLLFSCSPKITRGNLANPIPAEYSQPQLLDSTNKYIKQTLNKAFAVEDKSGSSLIDDSSSERAELTHSHDNGNYLKGPTMNAIDRALRPKHVGGGNDAITDKKHIDGNLPASHMTS